MGWGVDTRVVENDQGASKRVTAFRCVWKVCELVVDGQGSVHMVPASQHVGELEGGGK